MKKTLIAATSLLLMGNAIMAQPKLQPDNIDQVLQAMTLEEKATPGQTHHMSGRGNR